MVSPAPKCGAWARRRARALFGEQVPHGVPERVVLVRERECRPGHVAPLDLDAQRPRRRAELVLHGFLRAGTWFEERERERERESKRWHQRRAAMRAQAACHPHTGTVWLL
jgi:hypothetical protein